MERFNFNHLHYFYVVAKVGSIKVAAEKLHVSQPTISDQLKLLEDYLSCRLFERKNRGLVLTKQGQQALSYAEKIFDLSGELTSRLRLDLAIPKKSVDIGMTYYMSHYYLYDGLLPLFQKKSHAVNFKEGERHYLLADLEEGRLDAVLSDTKENISSTMLAFRIGTNRTFVVAHKANKSLQTNFPKSLDGKSFFNYTSETHLRYEIELFFNKYGIIPKQIGEGDDVDLLYTLTENNLAFTIVPEVAKNRFCLSDNIVVLGELKELQTSVWAITKTSYDGILRELFY